LISVIFAMIVPEVDGTFFRVLFAVSVIVIVNAAVTQWLSARGRTWDSVIREFFATLAINVAIALGYIWLLARSDEPIDEGAALFFVLLLTLLITLFDRYRHVRAARSEHDAPGGHPGDLAVTPA
jgi:hypothetical protein